MRNILIESVNAAPVPAVIGCILLAFIILLGPSAHSQQEPRQIKVFVTGTGYHVTIATQWFLTEPTTDPLAVPTRTDNTVTSEAIGRYMRIYFPRSFEKLLEYDFIVLADVDLSYFSPLHQSWLYDLLKDHPKGGVVTRSVMSAVASYYEPWRNSILSTAFPNDVDAVVRDERNFQGIAGPLVIKDDADLPDIMKSFKAQVEPIFTSYGGVNTMPRPGSTILSYTRNNQGVGWPVPGQIAHIFYWTWNQSTTFIFRDMFTNDFWHGSASRWNPYALDIMVNVVWFSAGRTLPDDPLKIHTFRSSLSAFRLRESILESLLDFAEKFGASTARIYGELLGIESDIREGEHLYAIGEFESAYERVRKGMGRFDELENEAMALKDRALVWIHLTEWLVTTGTLLIAGFLLWSLMVKRALYREAGMTSGT